MTQGFSDRRGQTEFITRNPDELDLELWTQGAAHAGYRRFASGRQEWGSGSTPPDVNLYRDGGGVLKTDSAFVAASLTINGEPVIVPTESVRVVQVAKVALGVGGDPGDVLAFNPGVDCYIERLVIDLTDGAAAACTLDFGVAADDETDNDDLIDGLDAEVTGLYCNLKDPGTNGLPSVRCGETDFVTGSVASGASEGLAGFVYIHYVAL